MAETGRPLKYGTVAELEEAIESYFVECDGKPFTDDEGKVIHDKNGNPIIHGMRPPTVTGLALHLGLNSRQALLNYQGRPAFNDTVTRAKARIEEYVESRLFDRDGVNGAKFHLASNFKGWGDKQDENMEALKKAVELLGNIQSDV